MRLIFTLLVCVLLLSTVVSAHTIERKEIIRSDGIYNVKFSADQEYPITGRSNHFDFMVWDNDGNTLSNLDLVIELRKEGQMVLLNTQKTEGHYSIEYKAEEFGVYTLSPIIDNQKVEIEFDIYVDTFGTEGYLTVGIILLFLLLLLSLMYKDCKRKKRGSKRR